MWAPPSYIIHVIGIFRPYPFFITLPLSYIILNINQRRKTGEVWERSYLGTALLQWSTGQSSPHLLTHICGFSFMEVWLLYLARSLSLHFLEFFLPLSLPHVKLSLIHYCAFPYFPCSAEHVLPVRINPYIGNNVHHMYIPYLKHVIQSSPRNLILRIYGWIQLNGKQTLPNYFGLIQFSPIQGMKPLSCPGQFILLQQRAVKNNFQEKELSHECSTLVFV